MSNESAFKAILVVTNIVTPNNQEFSLESPDAWYPDTEYKKGDQVHIWSGFHALCIKDHVPVVGGLVWNVQCRTVCRTAYYDMGGTQVENWLMVPNNAVSQLNSLTYDFNEEKASQVLINIGLDPKSIWNKVFSLGTKMTLDMYEEGLPRIRNEQKPLISVEATVTSIRGYARGINDKVNDYEDWSYVVPQRTIAFTAEEHVIMSITREFVQERY